MSMMANLSLNAITMVCTQSPSPFEYMHFLAVNGTGLTPASENISFITVNTYGY